MMRIWIVLLAVAVALAIALPAGAKKTNDRGFKPEPCEIDIVLTAGAFEVTPPKQFVLQPYTVWPATADGVLCLEVQVASGSLTDLRVRWLDYVSNQAGGSELYWARGKALRALNDGGTFSTGISLEGWTAEGGIFGSNPDLDDGDMSVMVMPKASTAGAVVSVEVGIDR